MHQRILVSSLTVTVVALGLILSCTIAAGAQEMVALTDMTGAAVKLTTFVVHLEEGKGDLSQRDVLYTHRKVTYGSGTRVFSQEAAIPLHLANGVFEFVTFDKISEYQSDGKIAAITLLDGGRVTGSPLAECTFKGEGALGEVSLSARDVRSLKFNPQKAKEHYNAHSPAIYHMVETAWPDKDKGKLILTLVSGDAIQLQGPIFVFEERYGGCDTGYIPCKPYSGTRWAGRGGLPVKYGTIDVELDFAKMQSFEVSPALKPATAPPSIDVTLRGGEKITATLNLDKGDKAIGLLGITANGFAQVPLERIKSISFLNQL